PEDLNKKIVTELHLEMPDVLAAVYRGEYPSRYLASFSKFLSDNINHHYTQQLIKRSFSEFFSKNVERYPDFQQVSVNFVGSIAFHYSGILQEVASERGISIGRIMEKPLKGLKEYHIPG
ncbi:MAG TPA: hypothetical protein VEP89_07205, partial [Draconibacterium sp.]|nr:hypothetical protein [Draconibacterium sp.]